MKWRERVIRPWESEGFGKVAVTFGAAEGVAFGTGADTGVPAVGSRSK